jgi:hypothetical protein
LTSFVSLLCFHNLVIHFKSFASTAATSQTTDQGGALLLSISVAAVFLFYFQIVAQ